LSSKLDEKRLRIQVFLKMTYFMSGKWLIPAVVQIKNGNLNYKQPGMYKAFLTINLLLLFSFHGISQQTELVVRYDFLNKPSPPDKPFYIRVYVDGVLRDSTRAHSPHHNLANAVRIACTIEKHDVLVEGMVIEKEQKQEAARKVMGWAYSISPGKNKPRIKLKMNEHYQVMVETIME
jgi:hypothetical protein